MHKNWSILKKKNKFQNVNLDFLTIQSLPLFKVKNKKIVPFLSTNKVLDDNGISFFFNPKVPLQKKFFLNIN